MKRALVTTAVVFTLASAIAGAADAQTAPSTVGALRGWDEAPSATQRGTSAQPPRGPQLRSWSDPSANSTNSAGATQRRTSNERSSSSEAQPAQRDASGAWVLPAMRVSRAQPRGAEASASQSGAAHSARDEEGDEQPIVIEMFEAPGVTPYPAPFALRPFGPPHRPLRLISSYDGDDDASQPRVTVTVAPALTIMRDYDGEPPQPPEVRIEVVAIPEANALILLPVRVLSRTHP
ncbi:MAG: hypothetical protein U0269_19825 [Polyangiales bacterium]